MKWAAAGLALLGIAVANAKTVHAANSQAVPVSVIPVTNKYQVNVNAGFYDLEMKPGQQTELQIKIVNASNKAVTMKLDTVAANTDSGSHVNYVPSTNGYDKTNKYPLPTLFNLPKSFNHIKIPAATTASFHLPMTMPKTQFKGIILGAVRVLPVVKQSKKAGVHNSYGYSVAIRLSNGIATKPNLRMNSVKVSHNFSGTTVDANLQNFKASMLRNGTLNTRVTKRGQNRTLKALQVNRASAAPNSNWTISTPWDGTVAPGDYTLHVKYTTTDPQFSGTKVWNFSKNFHISTVDAARYNLSQMKIPWWVYLILAVILLLLIVLIVLLVKRRKEANHREEK